MPRGRKKKAEFEEEKESKDISSEESFEDEISEVDTEEDKFE